MLFLLILECFFVFLAANVLMDDIGVHVKLADFGSCVDLRSIERGKNAELVGTLIFMAPEVYCK